MPRKYVIISEFNYESVALQRTWTFEEACKFLRYAYELDVDMGGPSILDTWKEPTNATELNEALIKYGYKLVEVTEHEIQDI